MTPYAIAAALASVAAVIAGQTLLKLGMNSVGPIRRARLAAPGALIVDMATCWPLWAGILLYAASAMAWLLALSTAPPALAYPFLGMAFLGVPVSANVFLGERLTPAQWAGVFLIIAGIGVVALAR